MTLLLLRVEAMAAPLAGETMPSTKTDEAYLDLESIRSANSLLQHVQQLGWELLPGAAQVRATYRDDEGDRCTLTEQTAKDALSFAARDPTTAQHGIDDTVILNISVCEELEPESGTRGRGPTSTSQEVVADELPQEEVAEAPDKGTAALDKKLLDFNVELQRHAAAPSTVRDDSASDDSGLLRQLAKKAISTAFASRSCSSQQAMTPAQETKMTQDPTTESMILDLVQQVEHTNQQLEVARLEHTKMQERVQVAELHAKEAQALAEEDAKRSADDGGKFMKDAEEAKQAALEADNSRQAALQASEAAQKLAVEKDHECEHLLAVLKEQAEEKEQKASEEAFAKEKASRLFEEALKNARDHGEELEELLAYQRIEAEESVQECVKLQVLADDLHRKLEESEEARRCAEKEKEHMRSLIPEMEELAEAKQRSVDLADELQQKLSKEETARNDAQMAVQRLEEHTGILQQTVFAEQLLRKKAEPAQQRAEESEQALQQLLTEERNARKEALETGLAAQERLNASEQLAEVLQQTVRRLEENLREEISCKEAAHKAQENAAHKAATLNTTAQSEIEALQAQLKQVKEALLQHEVLAALQKSMPTFSASVHMIEDCQLTLGIEAEEDVTARGDVTTELADLVSSFSAKQAFRIGRVHLPAGFSEMAPACARLAVKNDGEQQWPQTTVIVNVQGDSFGLQVIPLGSLEVGELKEIEMDMTIHSKGIEHSQKRIHHSQKRSSPRHTMPQLAPRFTPGQGRPQARSLWSIVDAATGACLGPLLVFEAVWDLP